MPVLAVLLVAQFMVILDITVVNIALPSIQRDLGFASDDLQWVLTAYTLALGGLLLVGGRAADLFGRRRMFVAGVTVFTLASLAAGLSGGQAELIAARVAQGVGGAMLSPAALSLIAVVFPEGPERHRALAIWGAVGAAGAAVGVLFGGLLTELASWEAIFAINVPIGIAVAFAALRLLPEARGEHVRRVDALGAVVGTAALVALTYGLVEADAAGWGSLQTVGLLAGSALGLGVFAAIESRVEDPLVELRLFRSRPTVIALVLMMIGMGALVSAFFFSSIYLQHELGHSALRTGVEFLPAALGTLVAAHAGAQLIERIGVRPVMAGGLAVSALGAWLLSGVGPEGTYVADVLPGLMTISVGIGVTAAGVFITAMSGATESDAGLISGLTSTAHELGIALVLSVLSAVAAAAGADVTAGIADAFRVAAVLALGGGALAAVGLRSGDVRTTGAAPAFGH